jgi:hypothetical protein
MTRARDVANIDGILTTKGDIYAATAASTPARLGVGSNGDTIVADSSTSTGLRYTAGTVQANPVLNAAFSTWQRGTSFTASSVYTADRWYKGGAPAATYSRQVTNDTTNLPFIQYCTRLQRNSGSTATNALDFGQSFESVNSIPFAGKTITFSFYARAGANFSASSSNLTGQVYTGTGTDQSVFTGFTGQVLLISTGAVLTTTWQRFTATATVASTATQIATYFQWSPTGTAGANDWCEVTGVQIDVGSVALPFRTYAGTIQGELAACQRYYYRQGGEQQYQEMATGSGFSAVNCYFWVRPPVTMRVMPTSVDYSSLAAYDNVTVVTALSAAIDTGLSSKNAAMVFTGHTSGITQFRPYVLVANGTTSGYIGLSAEL